MKKIEFYTKKNKIMEERNGDKIQTHIIGAQRHSSPTACTKLSLAVRTQVPTAICKLRLVANATGRCIIFMDSLLSFSFCPNLPYLLLITLKLLVQCPKRRKGKNKSVG